MRLVSDDSTAQTAENAGDPRRQAQCAEREAAEVAAAAVVGETDEPLEGRSLPSPPRGGTTTTAAGDTHPWNPSRDW